MSRRRRSAGGESSQDLPVGVIAWRLGHGLVAAVFLASIAYIWWCALTGRRGPLLRPAIAALAAEGALVGANGGDCPLGPLGDRIGDETPLFELVLPPRAAKAAVPALGAVAAAGVGVVGLRAARISRAGAAAGRARPSPSSGSGPGVATP